jgi:hypothetical protein
MVVVEDKRGVALYLLFIWQLLALPLLFSFIFTRRLGRPKEDLCAGDGTFTHFSFSTRQLPTI